MLDLTLLMKETCFQINMQIFFTYLYIGVFNSHFYILLMIGLRQ